MITESTKGGSMKTFRAIYRQENESSLSYDLLGKDLGQATSAAIELAPRNTVLVKVFHNPDW